MLGFACGAGKRKDCIKEVCLARHTDDTPESYGKANRNNGILPLVNRNRKSKKYSTRSLARERSPSKKRKRHVDDSFDDDHHKKLVDDVYQEKSWQMMKDSVLDNSKNGVVAGQLRQMSKEDLEREERKKMIKMFERMKRLDDSIVELEKTTNSSPKNTATKVSRGTKEAEDRWSAPRIPVVGQPAGNSLLRTGLKNLGNSCYMNSIIQSLACTTSLVNRLEMVSRKQAFEMKGISSELLHLAKALKSGGCSVISPDSFKKELVKRSLLFEKKIQQDAHEALVCILDNMEMELGKLGEEKVIGNIFDGKLNTYVECTECNTKSTATEPFRYLQLEIPEDKHTLMDCITSFTKEELMKDKPCRGRKPDGKQCNSSQAKRTISISEMPDVLVIQLKRFCYDGAWQTKIHKKIQLELMLELEKNTESVPLSTRYKLYSVISHYGGLSSGHYTANCLEVDKEWVHYDDMESEVKSKEFVEADKYAYILFYEKVAQKEVMKSNAVLTNHEGNISSAIELQKKHPVENLKAESRDESASEKTVYEAETERKNEEITSKPSSRKSKPSLKVRENDELKLNHNITLESTKKTKTVTFANGEGEPEETLEIKESDMKILNEDEKEQNAENCKKQQKQCNKCRKPWSGFHIRCDICMEWFHGKCVGVEAGEYGNKDEYRCNRCWIEYSKKSKEREKAQGERIKTLEKENEKMKQDADKWKAKKVKEMENKDKEKLKKEEIIKKLEEKIMECQKSEEKTIENHGKEIRKMKDEIEKRKREVQSNVVKMQVLQNKEKQDGMVANERDDLNKSLMKELEEMKAIIQKQLEEIDNQNAVIAELRKTLEDKEIDGTSLQEMMRLVKPQYLEAETWTGDDDSLETIKRQNSEIKTLKKEIAEYENRLDTCLCDAGLKERTIIHLNQHLDDVKLIVKKLQLQMAESELNEENLTDNGNDGIENILTGHTKKGTKIHDKKYRKREQKKVEETDEGDLIEKVETMSPEHDMKEMSELSELIDSGDENKERSLPPHHERPKKINAQCYFFAKGVCKYHREECRFKHVKKCEIQCKFETQGRCRNGNKCEFKHVRTTTETKDERQENKRIMKGKQDRDCRFFLKGNCNAGRKCQWRHDPDELRKQKNTKTEQKNLDLGMRDELHSLRVNQSKMMEEMIKLIRNTGRI